MDHFIEICTRLNLGELLCKPTRIFGGLLNKLYQMKTSEGYFAVKELLHKNISNSEILSRYELSEYIASKFKEHAIPTIEALKYDNKYVLNIGRSYFVIYPWIEALPIDERTSRPHVLKMAELLAQIHSIKLDIPKISANILSYHANEEIEELISLASIEGLKECKDLFLQLNNNYIDCLPILTENTQVTHCDLDYKNILWHDHSMPIVIDWESAGKLWTAQEFINMAIDWNGRRAEMDINLFADTIKTYVNAGGTLRAESIKTATAGTFGNYINWMMYNLKRSLDFQSLEEKETSINEVKKLLISFKSIFPRIAELNKIRV